jgi:hypothetical protein
MTSFYEFRSKFETAIPDYSRTGLRKFDYVDYSGKL